MSYSVLLRWPWQLLKLCLKNKTHIYDLFRRTVIGFSLTEKKLRISNISSTKVPTDMLVLWLGSALKP